MNKMEIDLTVKNYRCFPHESPMRIRLESGFVALVGPNNSGKSAVLRFFFHFRDLFRRIARGELPSFLNSSQEIDLQSKDPYREDVFSQGVNRDLEIALVLNDDVVPTGSLTNWNFKVDRTGRCNAIPLVTGHAGGRWTCHDGKVFHQDILVGNVEMLVNACSAIAQSAYFGTFRTTLPLIADPPELYFDIPIAKQFVETWGYLKTGASARDNQRAQTVEQEIARIFGFEQFQMNSTGRGIRLLIDGRSFDLLDVGTGITQFLVVLATAASRDAHWIFIDEPEINLHAKLQVDFLSTLASFAKRGIVLATHNIGLARATCERIYSVRQDGPGRSKIADFNPKSVRLAEFVGEMNFGGYRDLGFTKILLVEGRTDVPAVHRLLRKQKKDASVIVMPLGGTELINGTAGAEEQLGELSRISNEIFALIDSERTGLDSPLPRERSQFEELCKRVGVKCHVLKRRALENYWTDSAISKALGPGKQAPGLFGTKLGWAKSDNYKIAQEMQLHELEGTDLWEYLTKI